MTLLFLDSMELSDCGLILFASLGFVWLSVIVIVVSRCLSQASLGSVVVCPKPPLDSFGCLASTTV